MDFDLFFTVTLPAMAIVAGAGLLVRGILVTIKARADITWTEYFSVLVVMFLVATFVVGPVGSQMALADQLSFNEFWNGSLKGYQIQEITCTKDGPCRWEYQCDPYQCNPHDCNCTCTSRDDNGRCTSETCSTCYDTCYHDCPYCTREYNYLIHTNLEFPGSPFGPVSLAGNRLPINPDSNRWRSGVAVPQSVINRAGVGPTDEWLYYKARLDSGISDPMTGRTTYDNYILASEQTILREYSGDVDRLLSLGLLPAPAKSMAGRFIANKVYFAGVAVQNPEAWQDVLMRLNGALGPDLQGDLHVVVVNSSQIGTDPMTYMLALKAYWQDRERHGDNTISKNAIIVVVGTNDGQTVDWFRGTTGMPVGNETMVNEFERRYRRSQDVQGLVMPLTPEAVIGNVQIHIEGNPATNQAETVFTHSDGYLENIIWGLSDSSTQFERVSMTANDEDDVGTGFTFLRDEIRPKDYHRRTMAFVIIVLSIPLWALALYFSESVTQYLPVRSRKTKRYNY